MPTKLKVTCKSKKEEKSYNEKNPIRTTIELEIPHDNNSIYHKLSGGTNLELLTINKDAADGFVIGNEYEILISPVIAE